MGMCSLVHGLMNLYLERGLTMSADVRRATKQEPSSTSVTTARWSEPHAIVRECSTSSPQPEGSPSRAAAGGAQVFLVDISQPAIDVAGEHRTKPKHRAVRRCELLRREETHSTSWSRSPPRGSNLTSSLSTHRRLLRTRNLFRRHCRHIVASLRAGAAHR